MDIKLKPKVKLINRDGNAFRIISACVRILKDFKYPPEDIDKFKEYATSGDYKHLLNVVNEWFDVV
jgi:hypothetical protein